MYFLFIFIIISILLVKSVTVGLSEAFWDVIFCMAEFESTKKTIFLKFVALRNS